MPRRNNYHTIQCSTHRTATRAATRAELYNTGKTATVTATTDHKLKSWQQYTTVAPCKVNHSFNCACYTQLCSTKCSHLGLCLSHMIPINWKLLDGRNFTSTLLLQLQRLTHSLTQGRSSVNALWASDVMGSFPSSLALMPSWRDNKQVLLSSSGLSSTSQTPL